jgi:hypothetical protein
MQPAVGLRQNPDKNAMTWPKIFFIRTENFGSGILGGCRGSYGIVLSLTQSRRVVCVGPGWFGVSKLTCSLAFLQARNVFLHDYDGNILAG